MRKSRLMMKLLLLGRGTSLGMLATTTDAVAVLGLGGDMGGVNVATGALVWLATTEDSCVVGVVGSAVGESEAAKELVVSTPPICSSLNWNTLANFSAVSSGNRSTSRNKR